MQLPSSQDTSFSQNSTATNDIENLNLTTQNSQTTVNLVNKYETESVPALKELNLTAPEKEAFDRASDENYEYAVMES